MYPKFKCFFEADGYSTSSAVLSWVVNGSAASMIGAAFSSSQVSVIKVKSEDSIRSAIVAVLFLIDLALQRMDLIGHTRGFIVFFVLSVGALGISVTEGEFTELFFQAQGHWLVTSAICLVFVTGEFEVHGH